MPERLLCTYVCMNLHTCIVLFALCVYMHLCLCVHERLYMYVCICVHVSMFIYVCICVHLCFKCAHVFVCVSVFLGRLESSW
jgi:hypothetical protein